jgi:hypothetical protein
MSRVCPGRGDNLETRVKNEPNYVKVWRYVLGFYASYNILSIAFIKYQSIEFKTVRYCYFEVYCHNVARAAYPMSNSKSVSALKEV